MTSEGDSFESLSTGAGWEIEFDASSPTTIVAQGDPLTYLSGINLKFAGPKSSPLEFHYVALLGETVLQHAKVNWTGSGWVITKHSYDDKTLDEMLLLVIPLPPPIWLSAAGLAGVIVLRRRKNL